MMASMNDSVFVDSSLKTCVHRENFKSSHSLFQIVKLVPMQSITTNEIFVLSEQEISNENRKDKNEEIMDYQMRKIQLYVIVMNRCFC